MKKKLIFAFLGLLILFPISLFFVSGERDSDILSPLPQFLSKNKNEQVSTISLFLPFLENFVPNNTDLNNPPTLTSKGVLIYDLVTEKTLFQKNTKKRYPMASLTKIMTAIIALENKKTDNKYLVLKEHLVGENSMGLEPGEVLSLEELLYGLILPSGNDAAEVLASGYPGGRSEFVSAMNEKAKALGLKDTNFTNPSGLEGDGNQYSTVYDLVAITNYGLNNFPTFRKVVATYEYKLDATNSHKSYHLYNETNLLTSYPGVNGVKTGFTFEAGYCLVTYLDYQGHQLIGVILGSENRRQEMKDLLDYSLIELGVEPPEHT